MYSFNKRREKRMVTRHQISCSGGGGGGERESVIRVVYGVSTSD